MRRQDIALPDGRENPGISKPSDAALRQLLAEAIRRSAKKRPEIAAEMSPLVGVKVTENMLYDFTAQKKSAARFPAAFVKAFCEVVGSRSLYRLLLDEETLALIEVGKHAVACKHLVNRIATPTSKARGKR